MNGAFVMGVDLSKLLFDHIFTSSHGVVIYQKKEPLLSVEFYQIKNPNVAETSPSSGAAFTWIYK